MTTTTVPISGSFSGSGLTGTFSGQAVITSAVVPPASVQWVYHAGKLLWEGEWNSNVSANDSDTTGAPIEGPYDIAVTVTGAFGLWQPYISGACQTAPGPTTCFTTAGLNYLLLSLKPTIANQSWSVGFYASGDTIDGIRVDPTKYGPAPVIGQWGNYKIPLTAFNWNNPLILKFSIQDQTGKVGQVWYIDDVGFSAT